MALEADTDMAWLVGSEFTMTEVLARLVADGYVADFQLDDGVRCPNECAGSATVDATWRFEGASDPDDESIVLALRCSVCATLGVLTTAYGAMLSGPEADALAGLKPTAGRRPRPAVR
jgi:hypothetical protein